MTLFFRFGPTLLLGAIIVLSAYFVQAQTEFEGQPIGKIEIVFQASGSNVAEEEEYRLVAAQALGSTYSVSKIRDSIAALHGTGRIVSVVVSASRTAAGKVDLNYLINRKTQAETVSINVVQGNGEKITEQEILFKLNIVQPGAAVSEDLLQASAGNILEYLREKGYFNAEVTYAQTPVDNSNNVNVTFTVRPNAQARVSSLRLNIVGAATEDLAGSLKLAPGEPFSQQALTADIEAVKRALREMDHLAPDLDEPRIVYDGEKNTIEISISGKVGPKVNVTVNTEDEKIGSSTQRSLIPILREGTLDYAAIVEGERRLENFYQEKGFFFVNVKPRCTVEPPLAEVELSGRNGSSSEFLCSSLGGADLAGRTVEVIYDVDLNRRLQVADMRLRGTNLFTMPEIQTVLESQEANLLGFIPLFGYGHGLTSEKLLDEDANTIRSLLRELGYRDAQVHVNQGVTPEGSDLIITFLVEEGPPTVIDEVSVTGNKEVSTDTLLALVRDLEGKNYSRARIRNIERRLSEFYSEQGYFDARITSSLITPDEQKTDVERKSAKVVFTIENEGKKVVVNRILITGNVDTKPEAILKAITLKPNRFLKRTDVYKSEQNLYSSDVFSRVDIKPQPAGPGPDQSRLSDVIISVKEQPPRLMQWGGGYSTDLGVSGFFDIRHFNLGGNLWQGGARVRWSQRQQLVQVDFVNPRFLPDGKDRWAPLTLTAQYQQDSTVTRFFRSAFDKGTFGIVQRVDENGNPIDEFGNSVDDPTINRLTLTAETSRTINLKDRSVLFARYRFEDVRLFNIESLLVKDLLAPDSKIRISGLGATFVRDTRKHCAIKYSILETIAKGEPADRCKYDPSDPTNGDYFTVDYNFSAPLLGANIGFNKLQLSYNYYYSFPSLRNTTIAARAVFGVSNLFSGREDFSAKDYPELQGLLPISERFFAGGSNTLRGFDFEEAGPRVVVVPEGEFRDSDGEIVTLYPFTVPFGGNAIAVANIEGRIPLTKSIRAVPFYDGGNVYRKVGDIFRRPEIPGNPIATQNMAARWTHTVGLGLRLKTPIGGELGIDYGYLINPPEFFIPQTVGPPGIYRLRQGHVHFRFSQAF